MAGRASGSRHFPRDDHINAAHRQLPEPEQVTSEPEKYLRWIRHQGTPRSPLRSIDGSSVAARFSDPAPRGVWHIFGRRMQLTPRGGSVANALPAARFE
jgi:hypothetical protein